MDPNPETDVLLRRGDQDAETVTDRCARRGRTDRTATRKPSTEASGETTPACISPWTSCLQSHEETDLFFKPLVSCILSWWPQDTTTLHLPSQLSSVRAGCWLLRVFLKGSGGSQAFNDLRGTRAVSLSTCGFWSWVTRLLPTIRSKHQTHARWACPPCSNPLSWPCGLSPTACRVRPHPLAAGNGREGRKRPRHSKRTGQGPQGQGAPCPTLQ